MSCAARPWPSWQRHKPTPQMLLSNELLFIAADKTAFAQAEGGFARQVAVLVAQETNAAEGRAFLAKVLAAANLNLAQDTLLAALPVQESCAIAPDLTQHKPKFVLVFGFSPKHLGLSAQVEPYQPTSFYGCTWLFADRLSVLEPDKNKKTQLWTALKQIFL